MRFINRSRAGYLATLAAGIAIGFTAVGTAAAGSHPAVAKPIMHHYTIAASAFAPDSLSTTTEDYLNRWNPANLSNSADRCFNAGAILPNGVTIRSVTFFYTAGAVDTLSAQLNRQNLGAESFRILAAFNSKTTGSTPTYKSKTINISSHNVVDTSKYAYGLGVCPLGDATFSGVMINYTS